MRCFLFFTLAVAALSAKVETTVTLDPINEEIALDGEGTLLLIDVSDTLLVPKDPIFHSAHSRWRGQWFLKNLSYPINQEQIAAAVQTVMDNDENWFVPEGWVELMTAAQNRGITVAAFAKVRIAAISPTARAAKLCRFGLPLQDSLPELTGIAAPFTYADGLIQTPEPFKGAVLEALLSNLHFQPTKIIFVDNKMAQVESVADTCEKLAIPFAGFCYTAYADAPPLDTSIAEQQLKALLNNPL